MIIAYMNYSKQIIYIFLLLICGINISAKGLVTTDSTYKNFEYVFGVNNGKDSLKATLSIPQNFAYSGKVVIFSTPPISSDRNYFGLFSSISNVICKKGIAVLRFGNRAFSYPKKYLPGDLSMFDQADDLLCAIASLRNDERFAKSKIGLLGHSEGGTSVAIAAARSESVNFVVMLSPMGVSGKELSIYQMTNALVKKFPFMDSITKKRVITDAQWKVNLLTTYSNKDSIKTILIKYIDSIYKSNDAKRWFGQMSFDEVVKSTVPFWITNHRIIYSKFNPELYYPKIVCPSLIIFGTEDEKIDYRSNSENIVRIFRNVSKTNFNVLISKKTNHNYTLNRSAKIEKTKTTEFETLLFDKIAYWIKSV